MTEVHGAETRARARTRRAIVEAAVRELARDAATSLGQIADAAGVGRTTLHRYFPDRAALLDAVATETVARLTDAQARARLEEGDAREALLRLCPEYLLLGDLLTLLFTGVVPDAVLDGQGAAPLAALVARGHREGSIDRELDVEWAVGVVWAQLYLAWATLREGQAARRDVVPMLVRTVDKALAP
ncbi:helix-turn-helix domain-containing protein [Isoptericola sp. F-RaC21]|uniref:TetR/AcrR family transcriptional regulator n=1 Tax=Isoptericola sp. F-RaC21 TaxID=3141452 RepID=UPI00315BD6A2